MWPISAAAKARECGQGHENDVHVHSDGRFRNRMFDQARISPLSITSFVHGVPYAGVKKSGMGGGVGGGMGGGGGGMMGGGGGGMGMMSVPPPPRAGQAQPKRPVFNNASLKRLVGKKKRVKVR